MLLRASQLLFAVAAGCTAPPAPTAAELGNRIRVRIAARDIKSITTADYFLSFMVRGPDGRRLGMRAYAPAWAESEGLSLILGTRIEAMFDIPDLELTESLHAVDPGVVEDIVLPEGYTLCFEPGSFYAYRILDHGSTMAADLDPEIHLGAITRDGSRYLEVQPGDGPVLPRAADPPGWPLPELQPSQVH